MRDFHQPGRSPVFATNGLCATSHPLAAQAAIKLLEQGGNAVDAAIGAAVLLGICEPQMTGLGGDCFVLLTPPGGDDVIALNGSGRAPKGLSAENLRQSGHTNVPVRSVESVTLPGAVDAFCRLSKDWGRLDLAETLAPAMHYANAGVPVAPRTSFDWSIAERENHLSGNARNFYLSNNKAPKVGAIFRAPEQAEVLRRIASEGRAGFYEGEVAEDMIDTLQAMGGTHTLDDLATVSCDYTDPVSGLYKGTELVEHPPNGQGPTAILLNNILSHFDLTGANPHGAHRAHLEAEAAKLAYGARNQFIADADHTTRLDHMLSPETAAHMADMIDPKRAMTLPARMDGAMHKDTVYLTIVDSDLMAVSLIYSIFHSFGSGLASDKYGILFQNRGAGFTLEPGHPNEAAGGKRPMHTIIPGMLKKHGRVIMPFGVMGGAYQPCGHSRFVTNMVDFAMDPQTAIDAPRSFSFDGLLKVERGYSEQVLEELADLGHRIEVPEGPLGGAQAILIDHETGVLQGASDPRKDGCALGY